MQSRFIMLDLPHNAPGGEVLDALYEYMDSEELGAEFDAFVTRAMYTDEELAAVDDPAEENPDDGYCVCLQQANMEIDGEDVHGLVLSIWPETLAEAADSLPEHLDRDRHSRFLLVDTSCNLVTELYALPDLKRTLH
jgi:hypothetical protein